MQPSSFFHTPDENNINCRTRGIVDLLLNLITRDNGQFEGEVVVCRHYKTILLTTITSYYLFVSAAVPILRKRKIMDVPIRVVTPSVRNYMAFCFRCEKCQ